MSRLKTHLVEGRLRMKNSLFFDKIWKECSEILKLYLKENNYFYRGMRNSDGIFGMEIPREDRAPKDTPQHIHDKLDKSFKKKFGWRVRGEGVFTTPNKSTATSYGESVIVIPANDFKYVWSPTIRDLYSDKIENYADYNIDFDELYSEWSDTYSDDGVWEDGDGNVYEDIDSLNIDGYVSHTIHDKDNSASKNAFVTVLEDGEEEKIRLDWKPSVSWDEYYSQAKEHKYDNIENSIDDWVSEYKNTGIEKAIHDDKEIVFKCSKYYWFLERYKKDFRIELLQATKDRNQLEFKF